MGRPPRQAASLFAPEDAMTLETALAALDRAGTAQNRKIYGRHGVTGPQYGVSFAELKSLKKTIGTDHALALALWATGNHDARILATMVADPAAFGVRELDAWARDLDNYPVTDAFSAMVAGSPHARGRIAAWRDRKTEHVAACAFNVLAMHAQHDGEGPDEAWLLEQLAVIEAGIHTRPNRTRHSMNQALIAIGARGGALEKAALAAARRIGKVEVDHGQTSCQTPDASQYIARMKAHRAAKAKK